MSPDSSPGIDLLDLKMLPAWVKEPDAKSYAHYSGDEEVDRPRKPGQRSRPRPQRFGPKEKRHDARGPQRHNRPPRHGKEQHRDREPRAPMAPPPEITVRFLPRATAFENVADQIKSGALAYSLFHLARLFLEKPERYDVRVTAKPETPLYQLGEAGAVSADREFLNDRAFRLAQENFYKVEVTQGDPIKGNFLSVARDRLSGVLLGPTNYHTYQPRLRTLYEQRFSRRMSFADYQRQIEIVSEPELIERWKEEAQKVTTYTSLQEETPASFPSAAEAERHFRSNFLPGLIRTVEEVTVDGVTSRHLADRPLNRAIEEAWARENRSPSNLMQELASRFRQAGLHIFRHRRGMLFVSPIRERALVHEHAGVSASINAILETLAATPGINRKQLADKLIVDLPPDANESRKLALASDLHWLISVGHVIEFSDGSLDLPRTKTRPPEPSASTGETAQPAPPPAENEEAPLDATVAATPAD